MRLEGKTLQGLLNNSYMKTVVLPNMIRPDPYAPVPGFVVYVTNKTKSYQTDIPLGKLSDYRPHKHLQLANVKFSYRSTNTHNTFVGRGNYKLCGSKFAVEISRDNEDNVRIQGKSPDPVDVDKIELTFGMEQASQKMLKILKAFGVFSLRIMKPNVEMFLGGVISAKFSGLSYVEKFQTHAKTEILVGKLHKRYLLTTGMVFNDVPLGKFVSTFTGVYLRYLDMFQAKKGKSKVTMSLNLANDSRHILLHFLSHQYFQTTRIQTMVRSPSFCTLSTHLRPPKPIYPLSEFFGWWAMFRS